MSQSHHDHKQIVFFDIDSGGIAAGLASCQYDTRGNLIQVRSVFEVREEIALHDKESQLIFQETLKLLEKLATEVQRKASPQIEGIFCNLGSPWVSSQVRKISYHRPQTFSITESLIQKCINEEMKHPLRRNMDFHAYKDAQLIERRTIDIYLNGFPTRKALGQQAKSLDIMSLTSVMSEKTKHAFIHAIEKSFHREPVFFSNTFYHYQTIRELMPHDDSVVCIDVSGELTEVLVIDHDHLKDIASFPVGSNDLIRSLQRGNKRSRAEVASLLELYQKGKLDEHTEKDFRKELGQAFRLWFKGFYTLIDELAKKELLPATLVLSIDRRYTKWFEEEVLASQEMSIHLHAQRKISVINSYDRYTEYVRSHGGLDRFVDTELALLSYFITRIF